MNKKYMEKPLYIKVATFYFNSVLYKQTKKSFAQVDMMLLIIQR
jgi:hypothetical protein